MQFPTSVPMAIYTGKMWKCLKFDAPIVDTHWYWSPHRVKPEWLCVCETHNRYQALCTTLMTHFRFPSVSNKVHQAVMITLSSSTTLGCIPSYAELPKIPSCEFSGGSREADECHSDLTWCKVAQNGAHYKHPPFSENWKASQTLLYIYSSFARLQLSCVDID